MNSTRLMVPKIYCRAFKSAGYIKAFCINASQLWNRLPISVRNSTSLPVFKQGGSWTMRLACFRDHTFAIIVILDLTPYLLRWYVQITQGSKYADTVTIFSKSLTKRSMTQMTPRWPSTPLLLRSHVQLYPGIIVSNSHKNTSKHVDTVTLFYKNVNQRSMTPRWPLTPLLLRSHVWLYPRIIVYKSHGNISMFVDTVINFARHATYYILRTHYVRVITVFLNTVQVRQKGLKTSPVCPSVIFSLLAFHYFLLLYFCFRVFWCNCCLTRYDHFEMVLCKCLLYVCMYVCRGACMYVYICMYV